MSLYTRDDSRVSISKRTLFFVGLVLAVLFLTSCLVGYALLQSNLSLICGNTSGSLANVSYNKVEPVVEQRVVPHYTGTPSPEYTVTSVVQTPLDFPPDATSSPVPTVEPTRTHSPRPTNTPTNTPEPTSTPSPVFTGTPEPTFTPTVVPTRCDNGEGNGGEGCSRSDRGNNDED